MQQSDLHSAIRRIFADLGDDIIKSPNFASVVLDYNAYPKDPRDSSKQKNVMKDLVSDGYGKKIHHWRSNPSIDWKKQNDKYIETFRKKYKHDKDTVDVVSQAILYGAKLITEISVSWRNIDISSNLPESLSKLKTAYVQLLTTSITIEEDDFGLQVAYYSPESNAELFALEEQIIKCCDTLLIRYGNWCEQKKSDFLESVHKDIYSKNEVVRNKIQKRKKKRTTIIVGFSVIGIVVCFLIAAIIAESKARPYILAFNSTIAQGDSLAALEQYDKALLYYENAKKDYIPAYKSTKYKKIVDEKRVDLLKKLGKRCSLEGLSILKNSNFVTPTKCLEVKKILESFPSDSLLSSEEIKLKNSCLKEVDSILQKSVKDATIEMLNAISENCGKKNQIIVSQIDTLLLCDEDNYWLKIIKAK